MNALFIDSNPNHDIFRVADNQHEQKLSEVQKSHATAFWSKYWNTRVPDYRDIYTRDYETDSYDDNSVSGRNSRLDPRHVQMPGDQGDSDQYDGSNALRLQSSGVTSVTQSVLCIILVSVLAVILW